MKISMIRKITQMILTPIGMNVGVDIIATFGELIEACLFNVIPGTWFLIYVIGFISGFVLISASLLIWIEMILAVVLNINIYSIHK